MPTFRRFLSAVAPIIGHSENSCRELARAVCRSVTITDGSPRPPATPLNAAHILLAAIAGGPQRHLGDRVRSLFVTEVEGGITANIEGTRGQTPAFCEITSAAYLGDAVLTILTRPGLASLVRSIEVQSGVDAAVITARDGRCTRFYRPDAIYSALYAVTTVTGPALVQIAALVA